MAPFQDNLHTVTVVTGVDNATLSITTFHFFTLLICMNWTTIIVVYEAFQKRADDGWLTSREVLKMWRSERTVGARLHRCGSWTHSHFAPGCTVKTCTPSLHQLRHAAFCSWSSDLILETVLLATLATHYFHKPRWDKWTDNRQTVCSGEWPCMGVGA